MKLYTSHMLMTSSGLIRSVIQRICSNFFEYFDTHTIDPFNVLIGSPISPDILPSIIPLSSLSSISSRSLSSSSIPPSYLSTPKILITSQGYTGFSPSSSISPSKPSEEEIIEITNSMQNLPTEPTIEYVKVNPTLGDLRRSVRRWQAISHFPDLVVEEVMEMEISGSEWPQYGDVIAVRM